MGRNLCPEGLIIVFLNAVNVIFNLISKLPVHTAKILQNRCYLILHVYAKVLKACVHNNFVVLDEICHWLKLIETRCIHTYKFYLL
jgi:hypothetical protein